MREIKFRAWTGTEMIQVDALDGLRDGKPNVLVGGKDGGYPLTNKGILPTMQYTGLKDVNDVEIYEGDIICTYEYQSVNGAPTAVLWDEETTSFRRFYFSDKTGFLLGPQRVYKIVGNIHSTPELLIL